MESSRRILDSAYLKKQLIAYIGNKRRLLDFLYDVFSELEGRLDANRDAVSFGDCFAGSGSVSRLAKAMGYSVAANDWELYSSVINSTHIIMSPSRLEELFLQEGGISTMLNELNSLPQPSDSESYISRYYAPESTGEADYRYERLFYTRENALFIDAVRNRIEVLYPGWNLSDEDRLRKCALLAPLLYQAATHANTNGVFKAYHKGFGGHGADALTRIMADMRLQLPLTINGGQRSRHDVEQLDAAEFAAGKHFDICYLDPPYNQHQYGSNYFMLNTIARWDKPAVPMGKTPDGRLEVKAGIRSDWTETRSGFCYRKTAPAELRRLIENIDARFIVLSYNTEGIIPFDELFELLSSFGRTEIFCRDYIIYRGGRQSLGRANRNVEYQLVLSKGVKPGNGDRRAADSVMKVRSVVSYMNEGFSPERLRDSFNCKGNRVELSYGAHELSASAFFCYRFTEIPSVEKLSSLSGAELDSLISKLEYCRLSDKREEGQVLMGLISAYAPSEEPAVYMKLWRMLINTVRKFAFRKYRDIFEDEYLKLVELARSEKQAAKPGNWKSIDKLMFDLRQIADLRLNG